MKITLPYGRSSVSINLPGDVDADMIEPPHIPPAPEPQKMVRTALEKTCGNEDISSFAGARSVAIAISDKTRPVPYNHLLPPLLDWLESMGISPQAITFFIASGTHPPMGPEEFPTILPAPVSKRHRIIPHDASDRKKLEYLGDTSCGTPIWINKAYAHSDLKIVAGNIAPHQFAGFSGGVKSAAIGLAGKDTITHNHALMTRPGSQLGAYDKNQARQDIEEIGDKIKVHFALNAILNQSREIVHVLAGKPRAVMQSGIRLARQVCQVAVESKYRLVIASPGGHPKDINLYQSQKALAHAALVTRPSGTILLAAACPEGTGSRDYEEWMQGKESHEGILLQFATERFRIGPHKAYQIAREASKIRLLFYSDMDPNLSKVLLLNPITDLQEAVDSVLAEMQLDERVGILPHASSTIPNPETDSEE